MRGLHYIALRRFGTRAHKKKKGFRARGKKAPEMMGPLGHENS